MDSKDFPVTIDGERPATLGEAVAWKLIDIAEARKKAKQEREETLGQRLDNIEKRLAALEARPTGGYDGLAR